MGLGTTLDPARDLQRLNTLIINNLEELKCFAAPNSEFSKEAVAPEDKKHLHKNIISMIDTAVSLQKIHLTYRAMLDREMKYGSRQAPIGDDNYLHLMRNGLSASNAANAATNTSTTLPTLGHQRHHPLALDNSPKFFIRNEVLRNSLKADNFSHYWQFLQLAKNSIGFKRKIT